MKNLLIAFLALGATVVTNADLAHARTAKCYVVYTQADGSAAKQYLLEQTALSYPAPTTYQGAVAEAQGVSAFGAFCGVRYLIANPNTTAQNYCAIASAPVAYNAVIHVDVENAVLNQTERSSLITTVNKTCPAN